MNKNTIIKIFVAFIIAAIFTSGMAFAQKTNETTEIKIKTSAICEDCKPKVEKTLLKMKGVQEAALSVNDKVVTVKYDAKKTNPDKIRKSIAKLGYDADNVKGGAKKCCPTGKDAKAKSCCPGDKSKEGCPSDKKCKAPKTEVSPK